MQNSGNNAPFPSPAHKSFPSIIPSPLSHLPAECIYKASRGNLSATWTTIVQWKIGLSTYELGGAHSDYTTALKWVSSIFTGDLPHGCDRALYKWIADFHSFVMWKHCFVSRLPSDTEQYSKRVLTWCLLVDLGLANSQNCEKINFGFLFFVFFLTNYLVSTIKKLHSLGFFCYSNTHRLGQASWVWCVSFCESYADIGVDV